MKRPEDLIYTADEWPPAPKLAILGLQQVSLVSIYLVLLVIVVREAGATPAMARNTLSLAMIAMGAGAILQAVWKGPIGSGFLAPPVLSAMYLQISLAAAKAGGLPLVAGMTMSRGSSSRRWVSRSVLSGSSSSYAWWAPSVPVIWGSTC
jgi:xanthine permease XanP